VDAEYLRGINDVKLTARQELGQRRAIDVEMIVALSSGRDSIEPQRIA
jgi:hypothetical protein